MNILNNRVSTTFTEDELTRLATQHKTLMEILKPKTVALTPDELKDLSGIAVDNFVFVNETKDVTDAEGISLLPPSTADMVPELHIDVTFYQQLGFEEKMLEDLLTRIRHTRRLVAHESYNVANSVYKKFQSLAEDGVPGAMARYNVLKERYKDNGGGRPTDEK